MQHPPLAPSARPRYRVTTLTPFVLAHLACLAALWTGVTPGQLAACAGLYLLRMWGVTAGYHRYFSHRSYKTSRAFQLVLAVVAQSSAQKGVLWWAGHHRHHHRFSDQPEDLHSPLQSGFWWSHLGWIVSDRYDDTRLEAVRDLARFPELRWLNRHWLVPPVALAGGLFLLGGWGLLVWGFFVSTVLLWHGTFVINSLAHVFGHRRYDTADTSRNSFLLALVTLGEGWHNNHHHFQSAANQGFFWWELDPTWYSLKALSWAGVVWDLRQPPERVRNAHVLEAAGAKVKERPTGRRRAPGPATPSPA